MSIRMLPSGHWRVQIRRRNLRIDETHSTKRAAIDAQKGYVGDRKTPAKRGALTLDAAWVRYHVSLSFQQKKVTTQRSEETHIKAALNRFGAMAVESITAEDVEALILAGLKKKQAADTIRNAVSALSSVLRFCVERHIIAHNPCIGVRRPTVERKVRRMAPGDEGALMKLLAHPKLRYRSVARLCLLVRETGARPGEWAATRWDDIDLDQDKVTFRNTKYKGQPRTIPLTKAALKLLSEQLEDITLKHFEDYGASEYVFPTLDKEGKIVPLQYSGTVRDMKEEGLLRKELRAHNGRHEFISKLVEDSDIDDARIMALVGHHSPASMQIYAHARNVRFRGQLEALEPKRRVERANSLSKAADLPKKLIDMYLAHRRKLETDAKLKDEGDELLFTDTAIKDLGRMGAKLGETGVERMRMLQQIRDVMAEKQYRKPKK